MTERQWSLESSARRVEVAQRNELVLHEAVGSWARTTDAPVAKLYLDGVAQHHAWRAEQLGLCLPLLAGKGPGSWASGPDAAMAAAVVEMNGIREPEARVAVCCRVLLPRLLVLYTRWRGVCSKPSDGPIARALQLVSVDVADDWKEGTTVLVELLGRPGAAAACARATLLLDEAISAGEGAGAAI